METKTILDCTYFFLLTALAFLIIAQCMNNSETKKVITHLRILDSIYEEEVEKAIEYLQKLKEATEQITIHVHEIEEQRKRELHEKLSTEDLNLHNHEEGEG